MSDPISNAMVFQLIQDLRTDVTQQHVRLRVDVERGFDSTTTEIRNVVERMAVVETKLANMYESGCKAFSECQSSRGGGKRAAIWAGGAGTFVATAYEVYRYLRGTPGP